MARHERCRLRVIQVVNIRAIRAADLQDIAESVGRDQRRLDAFAFGQRVDNDRRAVHEEVRDGEVQTRLLDSVDDAGRIIRRSRGCLGDPDRPGLIVEVHQVRKGAADVTGYTQHAHHLCGSTH